MTDYAGDAASSTVGTTLTVRTGTASADTVPAGCYLVVQNTGAGTHVVTLDNQQTSDGLLVADRTWSVAAGGFKSGRVNSNWGDANGRVPILIDGTAAEVKYMIIGNV
jgi:hypothetical protein